MVLLLILIFLLVDWFMTITICCCAIVEIFTSRTLYCRNLWNTFRPNCLKRKRRRQTFRSWWRCTSTRSRRAAEARWPKKKQLRPHLFNIEVEVYVQKYESSPRHDRHSLSSYFQQFFSLFYRQVPSCSPFMLFWKLFVTSRQLLKVFSYHLASGQQTSFLVLWKSEERVDQIEIVFRNHFFVDDRK